MGAFDLLRLLLLGAGLLYALLLVGFFLFADAVIFPLPPHAYRIPDLLELESRSGDRIAALYLPAPDARVTLLFSHGNGEDLESVRPLARAFRNRGVSVLAYDYPGYGRSSGHASEKGVYAAIDACYRYLTEERGLAPDRIVLYGRSLGSGPSTDLAAREPVGGLFLEGGFVSAFRVLTRVRLLPWDKFENERKLSQVSCPVLVIQGERDEVVGYWHGPRLFAAAGEPKTFWSVERAGHNDLLQVAGDGYWDRILAFLDRSGA